MTAEKRVESLRARASREGAPAVALVNPLNIQYCTGFAGIFDYEWAHVGLVTPDETVLITDSRYFDALQSAARGTSWEIVLATTSLAETLMERLAAAGISELALETSMSHARFAGFQKALEVETIECSGWVEQLRQVKDAEEIACIDAAQQLTDRAFEFLLDGVVRAGVTEWGIALELEFFMRREGSEGVAFPPIVASGPNAARPHATPSHRTLADGDFVVLDFGARVGGYCADMTRTLVVGSATERHRAIYDCVLAANQAGAAAIHGGVLGREADAAARAVIESAGYGELFGHGLGHGVGLEVHELPGLGSRSEDALLAGSVVTVEPGIYVPEWGGVRIEDLAVVEEAGIRILTRSPRGLIEV